MPRRGNVPKREVLPDPQYNSVLVTKLVNSVMLDGKKGVAQKVVYGAFEIVENKTGKNGLEVFQQAMENIMPAVELKARRVGGSTYQVPIEVRPDRRQTLGDVLTPPAVEPRYRRGSAPCRLNRKTRKNRKIVRRRARKSVGSRSVWRFSSLTGSGPAKRGSSS